MWFEVQPRVPGRFGMERTLDQRWDEGVVSRGFGCLKTRLDGSTLRKFSGFCCRSGLLVQFFFFRLLGEALLVFAASPFTGLLIATLAALTTITPFLCAIFRKAFHGVGAVWELPLARRVKSSP